MAKGKKDQEVERCYVHPIVELEDGKCLLCEEAQDARARQTMARLAPTKILPIKITPGELFDRLTILELKAMRVDDPKKKERAAKEAKTIAEYIYGYAEDAFTLPFQQSLDALRDCNSRLWSIENRLRQLDGDIFPLDKQDALSPCQLEEFLNLARAVYVTNDERAKHKRNIDMACGYEPEIKQYAEY